MNNAQQTIRVGLFFILGLALAWITFEALSGGTIFEPKGYTLVAPFSNLKGLKNGDDVTMAGVKIGKVQSTRLGNMRVEAVLTIDPAVRIPNDAVASVEASNLLAGQHLAIGFGSSSVMLKPGDELKTKNSIDMNEVISQLGALGAKLEQVADGVNQAMGSKSGTGSILTKIDRLVDENGPKFTEAVGNIRDVSQKLNSNTGTIGRLMNDPKLHDELLVAVQEIKSAATDARSMVGEAQSILADVKAGRGAAGTLLYDPVTAESVKVTARNLRELSEKLNNGQGTFGKLLTDETLYRDVQNVVKKADRALEGMGDQGPITAVGIVANALF